MDLSPLIEKRVEALLEASRKVFLESPLALRAAILYGSSLGPGFRSDSDIDIAVLDDAQAPLGWREQAQLMDQLERSLKRGVDLRILRDGSPSHRLHALQQGLVIWERQPGDLDRYLSEVLPESQAAHERTTQEWPHTLHRLAGR